MSEEKKLRPATDEEVQAAFDEVIDQIVKEELQPIFDAVEEEQRTGHYEDPMIEELYATDDLNERAKILAKYGLGFME